MNMRPYVTKEIDSLPGPVRALATRLGCGTDNGETSVRFSQAGRMRSDARGVWTKYRATQTIALDSCSFCWTAQTGPFGSVRIIDALDCGTGRLEVTALGFLHLVRMPASDELDRAELMRYLAEVIWAPQAMVRNPHLHWAVLNENCFAVTAGKPGRTATVTIELNEDGRVASVTAPDRPMYTKSGYCPRLWFGRASDYRRHAGYWLPFRAEVGWQIEGERVVLWEGSLLDWAPVA
ncbi:hypothetical protein P3W85_44750 [Cupriavidus basilensis]|uniref:Uncharacterized protein n=1 Tax=Cupriavidus basilensis TaxID=68895 RepID=A0ABT6B525_9BURK|nr:DUF6544 family protein [Cupriavidus basilensis]MDF3839986.1 hypothetical protein [Cupriavidus basilensis]